MGRLLLAAIALLFWSAGAHAVDSFNGTGLAIPTLAIGAGTYSNVVVTIGSVVGMTGGAPQGSVDNYDPATNRLTIPAVAYQGVTYNNVTITVGSLISIGSVSGVDSVSGPDLLIPSLQVQGGPVYSNVVVAYGAIVNPGGGMPASIRDTYDPATRRLNIAAIQIGGKVYTNGVVTPGGLVSVAGPGIPVPGVVGEAQGQATTTIAAVGLAAGTVTTQASNTVAAGMVISETPVAGTVLAGGATVNLVVSSGSTPPQITTQPASQSVTAGQAATFSVVATGTAPLQYQWLKNGTSIGAATAASYTTPATVSGDSGSRFTVVVTNAGGSVTSSAATLTVNTLPQITAQPASQTVTAGQTATFSVTATGTAPLQYQWQQGTTPISGATAASYTTPVTTSASNGATFAVVVSNASGHVTSNSATLTVTPLPVAPQITTQPANQTVNVGQAATFSVTATGTAPLTYQWLQNGTAIGGATAASYTTPATTSGNNGALFSVSVSNVAGKATSAAATLTVNIPPQITTQPANQTIKVGQSASFGVTASGTAPLQYQWLQNGTAIGGATAASYTTPATTSANNGALFSVTVTNVAGKATSATATLTVNTPPQITTQPANQTVTAGQTATFSVVATGTAPLTYQWLQNGTAISSAVGASYTTPATTGSNNGALFTVIVTNTAGQATSNAATLTVNTPPQITTQPTSQTVNAGQTATFSVAATGTAPLTYQWLQNGSQIGGAVGASYTTPATTSGNNGNLFTVVVSNTAGQATSNAATLTVNSPPQITTQPASQTVLVGQAATFSVVASGTAPLQYQWLQNGTAISGATAASYTTPAATIGNNGALFSVTVTNVAGKATSTAATLTVTAASGTNVLTYKYDALRSGANPAETILTPANVNPTTFGLLHNLAVDGKVDAQPLYLSQLSVAGVNHSVVYVATEHDSVYAFDAGTGATLWQVSLIPSGETTSDDHYCDQVAPEIGITSTPVIDLGAGAHGVIYLVAMTKDASSAYHQRLHALDVTTGAELAGSPTQITASYGSTTFAPGNYKERAALLLNQGTIYTSWASHCDSGDYGGWIIAFNESTLATSAILNVAEGASGSGYENEGPAIWMSGGGPAADSAGNVYLLTANGKFDTTLSASGFPSGGDYGNSFLQLRDSGGTLAVTDYFAMYNDVTESTGDTDLGSGGIMLLPDLTDSTNTVRQLAVGAGKDGDIYVVDRNNMGGFNSVGNDIWQQVSGSLGGSVYSTPAWFNGTLYYGAVSATLKSYTLSAAKVPATPTSQSALKYPYPGTFPVISANGTTNGIVWAYQNSSPAVLHAYSAANLATELYNSSQAANNRDQFGAGNKFITPVVADGKVFVATTNSVAVFGILP